MRKINKELADLHADFLQYYRQNLGDKFKELEPIRKENLHRFIQWCGIFGLGIVIVICLFAYNVLPLEILDEKWFSYLVAIYLAVMFYLIMLPITTYKKETKHMVMNKILAFFGNFSYQMHKTVSLADLLKSGLFKHVEFQTGDDYFEGKYHGVNIQVSEEELYENVLTPKGRQKKTVFDGIIIVLDMNKAFLGQTIVRADWGIFNFLMNKPQLQNKHKLEKVTLEDCSFEKNFETFSDNQVEARYILTTAFMERILKVKELFHGTKIEFSFFDDKLLIAVTTTKDMFESTSLFTTTAKYGKMREVVAQFYSIFSIIDLLKLNQRIGM